jgi:hypothetical protein
MCCGVAMGGVCLYGMGVEQNMTDKECIEAGAYIFGRELIIWGCMKTFTRRDTLKWHADNPIWDGTTVLPRHRTFAFVCPRWTYHVLSPFFPQSPIW